MRAAPLTTIKGGINRIRTKGGARADMLYDLVNGFCKDAGTIVARPGTARIAELDPLTRGLVGFDGTLHTFCHTQVSVPSGITLNLIVHPDIPATDYEDTIPGNTIALEKIHFAEPFMGALYVAAEFENGNIYHYWLQPGEQWEASKVYKRGDIVYPSTPTGFVYQASRLGSANPAWAPDVPRYDDYFGSGYTASVIEPTVYNDYYYTCIATTGASPRSGSVEPAWPTEDGATVIESTDNPPDVNVPTTATITPAPSSSTTTRYGSFTNLRTVLR
jgi:hypothetical protein